MNKILILVLIIFFSCKKEINHIQKNATVTFVENDFKSVLNLESIELTVVNDSVYFASRVIIDDDFLYICEEKTDKFLHAIKLPTDEYIGIFGNKGKGPGEILASWALSSPEKGRLLVLDPKQKKVVELTVDSLMKKNIFKREYKLGESTHCHDVIIYNEKMYFTDQNNDEYRMSESDLEGEEVKGYGKLPQNDKFSTSENKGKVSRTFMVNNKNIFAFSYFYYPLIELYDIDKNEWVSIVGPDNEIPSPKFVNRELVYGNIRITDDYIYVLYLGRKGKMEMNVIFVFDHKGLPIKKLILEKNIFSFDVYKDKFIYGLNYEEGKVLKFEIKK